LRRSLANRSHQACPTTPPEHAKIHNSAGHPGQENEYFGGVGKTEVLKCKPTDRVTDNMINKDHAQCETATKIDAQVAGTGRHSPAHS
jgi:hypothetical protein